MPARSTAAPGRPGSSPPPTPVIAPATTKAARLAGRPVSLTLVRHAESERNVARNGQRFFATSRERAAVAGTADHRTPLTARGRRQADVSGPRIWAAHGPFDLAWHSGYARTRETLERLLDGAPPRPRARVRVAHHLFLRERDSGYTYDMTEREVRRAFPWLQAYWDTYGPVFGRPPGGESLADVAKRGYLFLNMVFREAAGKRVLVVSHGGTMWMLRMLLERWAWDEAEHHYRTGVIPQCSVMPYVFDRGAGRLVGPATPLVHYDAGDLRAAASGDRG